MLCLNSTHPWKLILCLEASLCYGLAWSYLKGWESCMSFEYFMGNSGNFLAVSVLLCTVNSSSVYGAHSQCIFGYVWYHVVIITLSHHCKELCFIVCFQEPRLLWWSESEPTSSARAISSYPVLILPHQLSTAEKRGKSADRNSAGLQCKSMRVYVITSNWCFDALAIGVFEIMKIVLVRIRFVLLHSFLNIKDYRSGDPSTFPGCKRTFWSSSTISKIIWSVSIHSNWGRTTSFEAWILVIMGAEWIDIPWLQF